MEDVMTEQTKNKTNGLTGSVSVHDKYQIEMKFSCPMDTAKKINDYHIDVFFFLPRNLAVNRQTYPERNFYRNLSEYIRLGIPEVGLDELADPGNPALRRFADASRELQESGELSEDRFTEHLEMFCSIAKMAFRDTTKKIETLPKKQRAQQVPGYLASMNQVLRNFRQLRPDPEKVSPARLEMFDLADEFLSITANRYCYHLWKNLPSPEESENVKHAAELLHRQTEDEILYREKSGCPSVPKPEEDNSELLYRESTLKKAMGGVLYLYMAMRRDGVLVENLLLSISAAIAMVFVTGISFLWKGLFLEEFSLSFFIVWVVAYMFKDRIKSLLQAWFSSHKDTYAFDYRMKISDAHHRTVGLCREGVCYRSEETLPPEVMKLRARTALSRLDNGSLSEEILVFRKRIELYSRSCDMLCRAYHVNSVADIVRFNVRDWLRKMDNPFREVNFPKDDGSLGSIRAKRIYHVNMVIRYRTGKNPPEYMKYRLLLARNGIQRVEEPAVRKG